MDRTLSRVGLVGGGVALAVATGLALVAITGWTQEDAQADVAKAGTTRIHYCLPDGRILSSTRRSTADSAAPVV